MCLFDYLIIDDFCVKIGTMSVPECALTQMWFQSLFFVRAVVHEGVRGSSVRLLVALYA